MYVVANELLYILGRNAVIACHVASVVVGDDNKVVYIISNGILSSDNIHLSTACAAASDLLSACLPIHFVIINSLIVAIYTVINTVIDLNLL